MTNHVNLAWLVLALMAAGTAVAQTNTFPASGNVGIGTTAPNGKLNIKATSTYSPNNGIYESSHTLALEPASTSRTANTGSSLGLVRLAALISRQRRYSPLLKTPQTTRDTWLYSQVGQLPIIAKE